MPVMPAITADVADSTSATLTDTGMAFPVSAGRMYYFRAHALYTSAASTTGLALAVDVPAAPTAFTATATGAVSSTVGTDAEEVDTTGTDSEQMTFSAAPAVGIGHAIVEGFVRPSVAGEVKIQFNTEVNGSAVTVKAGSFIEYRDLGV